MEVASGQPGEDVSIAASGTDQAWQIVMNFVQAVVGASSGVDARFASVDRPATMANHVWIFGVVCWWWRGAGGGAGPFMALDNAKEGVCWLLPVYDRTDDDPVRRPWLAERQRLFAATMEILGLKVGG